jgi:hypothetical protein
MTFIISLGNADQIIQVSDRRLTSNSDLVDDSFNKVGHVLCDDASFLYSFTGLATFGKHKTNEWLLQAFDRSIRNGSNYSNIAYSLAAEATDYFRNSTELKKLSGRDRRLTIMLSGYTASGLLVNTLITNFQDYENGIDFPDAKDCFTVRTEESIKTVSENPVFIQVIGQFNAFRLEDEAELRGMLKDRISFEAIIQKAVGVVQKVSENTVSRQTVGKKINTARLPFSDLPCAVSGYFSDILENEIHLIDQIDLRTGGPRLRISDVKLVCESPIVFPKIHRNANCPCGSGLKYRLCHRPKR